MIKVLFISINIRMKIVITSILSGKICKYLCTVCTLMKAQYPPDFVHSFTKIVSLNINFLWVSSVSQITYSRFIIWNVVLVRDKRTRIENVKIGRVIAFHVVPPITNEELLVKYCTIWTHEAVLVLSCVAVVENLKEEKIIQCN